MCLLCNKVLSNDSMKPSGASSDKTGIDLKYFQILKEKLQKRPTECSLRCQNETMMVCRCLTISHYLQQNEESRILSGNS